MSFGLPRIRERNKQKLKTRLSKRASVKLPSLPSPKIVKISRSQSQKIIHPDHKNKTRPSQKSSLSKPFQVCNKSVTSLLYTLQSEASRQRRDSLIKRHGRLGAINVSQHSQVMKKNSQMHLNSMCSIIEECRRLSKQEASDASEDFLSQVISAKIFSPRKVTQLNFGVGQITNQEREIIRRIQSMHNPDNRKYLVNKVKLIKKERRKQIGGQLIVSENKILASNPALLAKKHKKWKKKERKLQKLVGLNQDHTWWRRRSTVHLGRNARISQVDMNIKRKQKQFIEWTELRRARKMWLSLNHGMIPRLECIIGILTCVPKIMAQKEHEKNAVRKIEGWYLVRMKMRNKTYFAQRMFIKDMKARRIHKAKLNHSADVIRSFLSSMIKQSPMMIEIKKKSYVFKRNVIKLQRWFRRCIAKRRKQRLRLERKWIIQEKVLRRYADQCGEYFHSIPVAVRGKVINALIDKHRRIKKKEFIKYIRSIADLRNKNRYNVKWLSIKRSMGIPIDYDDIKAMFNWTAKAPSMRFEIPKKKLKNIIERTSRKQLINDMQNLLQSDNLTELSSQALTARLA